MKTSKAAVFHGAYRPLTLETTVIPDLRDGEILIRNEYATLCRSDLNTFCGKRTEKTPTILGHETVGVIEALGLGAPREDCRGSVLGVGDRVTWAIFASNPDSELARAGIPQKAPGLFKYGHEQLRPDNTLHGGLAEHCILRRHTPVIRLDRSLPLPCAALINCSVATVAGSLRLAGRVAGQNVFVAGAGSLGLTACAMCKEAGARCVVAGDIDQRRLEMARVFGADKVIAMNLPRATVIEEVKALLAQEAISLAFDYSGVPECMETMVELLGTGGTAIFVGATFPQRPLHLSAEHIVRNLHTIKGLHNYNVDDLKTAVEFMEGHYARYPFAELVSNEFDLETVNEAFACGLQSGACRVGVRLNSAG